MGPVMKTRRSFASSLHLAIFATALFMLSAAASALTTIQSITSQPNPAQPGQTVLEAGRLLQIGGDATTGRGLVTCSLMVGI